MADGQKKMNCMCLHNEILNIYKQLSREWEILLKKTKRLLEKTKQYNVNKAKAK